MRVGRAKWAKWFIMRIPEYIWLRSGCSGASFWILMILIQPKGLSHEKYEAL
jgi:hypothetical protein